MQLFKRKAKSRLERTYVRRNHLKNLLYGIGIGINLIAGGLISTILAQPQLDDSPIIEREARAAEVVIVYEREENLDTWIDGAVRKYLNSHYSEAKMIMHCLAHRESGHGQSNAMGDGGLAGGAFQFHEETWQRMRKQMLKAGLIDEIGDRFDVKQATYTTAWAIANGRSSEWGPLKRDLEGSDFASCQFPSWQN